MLNIARLHGEGFNGLAHPLLLRINDASKGKKLNVDADEDETLRSGNLSYFSVRGCQIRLITTTGKRDNLRKLFIQ